MGRLKVPQGLSVYYRHSPDLRKVWRKLNLAQVRTEYTCVELCT